MLRRWVPDAWLADERPAAVDAAAGALRRGRDGLLLLWRCEPVRAARVAVPAFARGALAGALGRAPRGGDGGPRKATLLAAPADWPGAVGGRAKRGAGMGWRCADAALFSAGLRRVDVRSTDDDGWTRVHVGDLEACAAADRAAAVLGRLEALLAESRPGAPAVGRRDPPPPPAKRPPRPAVAVDLVAELKRAQEAKRRKAYEATAAAAAEVADRVLAAPEPASVAEVLALARDLRDDVDAVGLDDDAREAAPGGSLRAARARWRALDALRGACARLEAVVAPVVAACDAVGGSALDAADAADGLRAVVASLDAADCRAAPFLRDRVDDARRRVVTACGVAAERSAARAAATKSGATAAADARRAEELAAAAKALRDEARGRAATWGDAELCAKLAAMDF